MRKRLAISTRGGTAGLILACLLPSAASAIDYSLPDDIGSGAFAACTGGSGSYTCSGDLDLDNDDTVTLGGDLTLIVGGDFNLGNNVILDGGGFEFVIDVGGNVNVGNDAVIAADIVAGGDIDLGNNTQLTGNLAAGGNLDLGNNGQFTGDLSAEGDIDLGNNGQVTGDIDAGGDVDVGNNASIDGDVTGDTLDFGNGTTVSGTCTPPHPICNTGGSALDHFVITPATTAASTCLVNAITVTAENAAGDPLTDYAGAIVMSTSSGHGNWSIGSALGALSPNPDSDDDGAASYAFVAADNGVIILNLANTHAETLTITVSDPAAGVSSTSVAIGFASNVFVITEDAVQVAGRPQAMSVAMWTDDLAGSGSCGIDTTYDYGGIGIDASLLRGALDPGGAAPSIGGVNLPDDPASNSVTLDFSATPGQAAFSLDSTDVGQYRLTLTDNSNTHGDTPIGGSSALLTVRPFGLAIGNVNAGGTPISTPPTDPDSPVPFAVAGGNFSATVTAVQWSAADDSDNDGVLDGGTYADNAVAASYDWPTDLSVSTVGTEHWPTAVEGGVPGVLAGGGLAAGGFTAGAQTAAALQYSEVGAFTLQASALDYLGVGSADIDSNDVIVGRFTPAEFALTEISGGTLFNANTIGDAFTYVGQTFNYDPADRPAFLVTALSTGINAGTAVNYIGDWSKMDASVTAFTAPTADDVTGAPLTYTQPAGFTFTPVAVPGNPGTFRVDFGDDDFVFDKDITPLAPFPSTLTLLIDSIADGDGIVSNSALSLLPSAVLLRYGRLRMENAFGSELSNLDMPFYLEYYDPLGASPRWIAHDDLDTVIPLADVDLSAGVTAALSIAASPTTTGLNFLELQATNVDVTETVTFLLGSSGQIWLRYDWDGDSLLDNPSALATFGVYEGNPAQIYLQQIYP